MRQIARPAHWSWVRHKPVTNDEYTLRAATAAEFDRDRSAAPGGLPRNLGRGVGGPGEAGLRARPDHLRDRPGRQRSPARSPPSPGISPVPGGSVPAGHVTMVGVRAIHRRRGLLRRMMHRQLAEIRDRGEPVAVLWASEGRIYQRFGYGLAAGRLAMELDQEVAGQPARDRAEGRLRSVTAGTGARRAAARRTTRCGRAGPATPAAPSVVAQRARRRTQRPARAATPLRVTVHEGAAGVDGYARVAGQERLGPQPEGAGASSGNWSPATRSPTRR